jgi:hypothetical protein
MLVAEEIVSSLEKAKLVVHKKLDWNQGLNENRLHLVKIAQENLFQIQAKLENAFGKLIAKKLLQ